MNRGDPDDPVKWPQKRQTFEERGRTLFPQRLNDALDAVSELGKLLQDISVMGLAILLLIALASFLMHLYRG